MTEREELIEIIKAIKINNPDIVLTVEDYAVAILAAGFRKHKFEPDCQSKETQQPKPKKQRIEPIKNMDSCAMFHKLNELIQAHNQEIDDE